MYGIEIFKYIPLRSAVDLQEIWVVAETCFKRNGFFIEIGVVDGIFDSTAYLPEKQIDWRGILSEANLVHHGCIAPGAP